jgi:plasmid replication initiation protein
MRTLVRGFNEPQGNIKVGEFNGYEQRSYDFDKLEKELLGWDNEQQTEE